MELTIKHISRKTLPLTLKEVLQLRDGRKILRNQNTRSHATALPPFLQSINYLSSPN